VFPSTIIKPKRDDNGITGVSSILPVCNRICSPWFLNTRGPEPFPEARSPVQNALQQPGNMHKKWFAAANHGKPVKPIGFAALHGRPANPIGLASV